LHAEHELHNECEHKGGYRNEDHAQDENHVVGKALATNCSNHPQQHSEGGLHDPCGQCELNGHWPALCQLVCDRPPIEVKSKIAIEETSEILDVLERQGVIKVVALAQCSDCAWRYLDSPRQ